MRQALPAPSGRDQDIVELLQQGRPESAFTALLERYEGKVYRLCCALLGEHAQAQDAAQDSLVRVWRALGRYDGRASLSSWIYAITRNRCLTALARRRPTDSLDALLQEGEEAHLGLAHERDAADPDERSRQVLRLYYFEERSVAEVAAMLGCPQGTVKTTLFRARAALSGLLERRGLADPAYWRELET
jgi:RNA polymerase sigma-70 factor (ECF subfamily)